MRKVHFLIVAVVFTLAAASIQNALCYPPAGTDHIGTTTAGIELHINEMFNETMQVRGHTYVNRSNAYDPGDGRLVIETEIISMQLTGTSAYIGPVTVVESSSKKSNGTIRQVSGGIDFPAESFFDVFIEIVTTLPSPLHILHNDVPAHMSATVMSIPPWGSNYTYSLAPIELKAEDESVVGNITHAFHYIDPLVGGLMIPLDKLGILLPYVAAVSGVTIAAVALTVRARRARKKEK